VNSAFNGSRCRIGGCDSYKLMQGRPKLNRVLASSYCALDLLNETALPVAYPLPPRPRFSQRSRTPKLCIYPISAEFVHQLDLINFPLMLSQLPTSKRRRPLEF
jgi:hypothetical protein